MKAKAHKQRIQSYFAGKGFERFRLIYGEETGNRFQQDVRHGHLHTRDTILSWLHDSEDLAHLSLCDVGCGVGTMSIPLAQAGARVHAIDFSHQMIDAATSHATALLGTTDNPRFEVHDFAGISGAYDTVVCIDVFSRYPTQSVIDMLHHLSALADSQCIVSFTPKTRLDRLWLTIGTAYAKRHDVPLLYTHREKVIVKALEAIGWEITRRQLIRSRLHCYFCCLVEARRPPGRVLQRSA